MPNQYLIAGPFVDEEAQFWNAETGWGSLERATRYNKSIFLTPLPLESIGVWELTEDGNPTNFYMVEGCNWADCR
jgi:hypothetical protein